MDHTTSSPHQSPHQPQTKDQSPHQTPDLPTNHVLRSQRADPFVALQQSVLEGLRQKNVTKADAVWCGKVFGIMFLATLVVYGCCWFMGATATTVGYGFCWLSRRATATTVESLCRLSRRATATTVGYGFCWLSSARRRRRYTEVEDYTGR